MYIFGVSVINFDKLWKFYVFYLYFYSIIVIITDAKRQCKHARVLVLNDKDAGETTDRYMGLYVSGWRVQWQCPSGL